MSYLQFSVRSSHLDKLLTLANHTVDAVVLLTVNTGHRVAREYDGTAPKPLLALRAGFVELIIERLV